MMLKAEGDSGPSSQVVTVEEMKEHGREEETMVVVVEEWWLRMWQMKGDSGGTTIGVKGKTRMGVASGRQTRGSRNDGGKGRWYTSDGGVWMTDWRADDSEQQDK
jgi:hypothetical protein